MTNDGQGIFESEQRPIGIKSNVADLVAGDLDNDGDLDLAIAYEYSYDGNVGVILNDGQGGFASEPSQLTVAGSPTGIALGDLDADGDLDLTVVHGGGIHIPYGGAPGISVFMGLGNGRFASRNFIRLADNLVAAVSDFDQSEGDEIAILDHGGIIEVMQQREPELFSRQIQVTTEDDLSSSGNVYPFAKGDWNGDGLEDVIQGPVFASGDTRLGISQPDGSSIWTTLPTYVDANSWIIADLTGDGLPDIGVIYNQGKTLAVIPQLGNGELGMPVDSLTLANDAYLQDPYDYDADGFPDVLLRDGVGRIRVMFGTGGGAFEPGPEIGQGDDVRTTDLNRDAYPDLLILANNHFATYLGAADGGFQQVFSVAITGAFFQEWTDFTGDGQVDVILSGARESHVLIGKPDGTFDEAIESPLRSGNAGLNIWFEDMNRDGRPDLQVQSVNWGELLSWLVTPEGSLATPAKSIVPRNAYPVAEFYSGPRDINGDQNPDIALASSSQFAFMLGQSDGSFLAAFDPILISGGWNYISLSDDHDADGVGDLTILSPKGLTLWLQQDDGTFVEYFQLPVSGQLADIRWVEDLNGDGRTDYVIFDGRLRLVLSGTEVALSEVFAFGAINYEINFGDWNADGQLDAVTGSWDQPIQVWHNQGDWTFAQAPSPRVIGSLLTVRDVNRDGWSDLVVQTTFNGDSSGILALLNVGGLEFVEGIKLSGSGTTWSDAVQFGDLNRDGHDDLVVGWGARGPGQRITILLSESDGTFGQPVTYVFSRPINLARVVLGDIDGDGDLDVTLEGHRYNYYGDVDKPITRTGIIYNRADQLWPVGDANRDGVFNSSDLVRAFQAGEYEDDVGDNSAWTEGDWDGDGDFTTSDLVFAFQRGTYTENADLRNALERSDIAATVATRQSGVFDE